MPFRSRAQAAYLEHHPEKIGGKAALEEWEEATKGHHLPERAGDPPGDKTVKKPLTHIANEIERKGTKGVFSAAAKRAGKSTEEFAEEKKHAKGKIGARARMALVFMHANK